MEALYSIQDSFFRIDLGMAIATIIGFFLITAIFWKPVWKTISDAIDARDYKIKSEHQEAEKKHQEVETVKAKLEEENAAAREEAMRKINEAVQIASQKRMEILDKIWAENKTKIDAAKKTIIEAHSKSSSELENMVKSLAQEMTQKLIHKTVNPDEYSKEKISIDLKAL